MFLLLLKTAPVDWPSFKGGPLSRYAGSPSNNLRGIRRALSTDSVFSSRRQLGVAHGR